MMSQGACGGRQVQRALSITLASGLVGLHAIGQFVPTIVRALPIDPSNGPGVRRLILKEQVISR